MICLAIMVLSVLSGANALVQPIDPECGVPLGMENGEIKDGSIRGYSVIGAEAKYARLNGDKAWCFQGAGSGSGGSWDERFSMVIDFGQRKMISALAVQGSPNSDHSYGDRIRLSYMLSGIWYKYTNKNDADFISVNNKRRDQFEFILLDPPILTQELRIQLVYDSNPKCLRAEFYGCKEGFSIKEYKECSSTGNAVLTERLDFGKFFNQSSFQSVVNGPDFTAQLMLFSREYAWCVTTTATSANPYGAWASVDLIGEYLLYSLQVDGFYVAKDTSSDRYLPETFKIAFSLDAIAWATYYGGKIFNSSVVRLNKYYFPEPVAAKYVKIFLQLPSSAQTAPKCIKLQMFGCEALSLADVSTTPFTPPMPNATTVEPSEPARIYNYVIPQGSRFSSEIVFTDSKYSGSTNKDGLLSGGSGCLTDGLKYDDPITSPVCWVGWSGQKVEKPFIELKLSRIASLIGVELVGFINESAGIAPYRTVKVSAGKSDFVGLSDVGYACSPSNYYGKAPMTATFKLSLGSLRAQVLLLEFSYSQAWILFRSIKVIQQGESMLGGSSLSAQPPTCVVPDINDGKQAGSSSTNVILVVCIILAILFLSLLVFIVYHYRTSLHRVILKHSEPAPVYRQARIDENRVLMKHQTENVMYEQSGRNTPATYVPSDRSSLSYPEQVYAAPDLSIDGTMSSKKSSDPSYLTVGHDYAHYAPSPKGSHPILYAQPNAKQYAEPDANQNPIYAGSVIYSKTYANPYNAVVASSLYSDPSRFRSIKKSSIKVFPRNQLKYIEKIGVGNFGDVHICQATGLDEIYGTIGHFNSWGLPDTALVAVKMLKMGVDAFVQDEFMKEVSVMAQLKHENVVRLLGVCEDEPMLMVVEYMENGDLNAFLHNHRPYEGPQNVRVSQLASDVLLLDTLMYMATQIAAGVKYLHAEGFVHRDLAARNCLVGPAYQVKISDFGMSRNLYSKQYYRIEGKAVLPIRWMAPECIYYGKFTCTTDVWSFGVTLWEMLSFARQPPYNNLSDQDVIEETCSFLQTPNRSFSYLEKPAYCPGEVYAIMVKCWQRLPEDRPTMSFIYQFFKDRSESTEGEI